MIRKCPGCGGKNVRRSSAREVEANWRHEFLSPYRCRDCTRQFWVISRKVYVGAAYLAAAIAVVAVFFFLLNMWLDPGTAPVKRPRRSDGGQQERVQVADGARFTLPRITRAARATLSSPARTMVAT